MCIVIQGHAQDDRRDKQMRQWLTDRAVGPVCDHVGGTDDKISKVEICKLLLSGLKPIVGNEGDGSIIPETHPQMAGETIYIWSTLQGLYFCTTGLPNTVIIYYHTLNKYTYNLYMSTLVITYISICHLSLYIYIIKYKWLNNPKANNSKMVNMYRLQHIHTQNTF